MPKQEVSYLSGLSVGGLNAHTAEPEHAASAAAGRQQLLDDGFILLLQRQHDSGLQEVQTQETNINAEMITSLATSVGHF